MFYNRLSTWVMLLYLKRAHKWKNALKVHKYNIYSLTRFYYFLFHTDCFYLLKNLFSWDIIPQIIALFLALFNLLGSKYEIMLVFNFQSWLTFDVTALNFAIMIDKNLKIQTDKLPKTKLVHSIYDIYFNLETY